jgi:hypothetical protein
MVYRHHLLAMWEGMSEGTVGIRITEWTTPCSSDVRGKEKQPKTTGKKRFQTGADTFSDTERQMHPLAHISAQRD